MSTRKIFFPVIIMALLASCAGGMYAFNPALKPSPVSAATLGWSEVNTPGIPGEVLQAGTDVSLLAVAPDGLTIFAYGNVGKQLYKSVNSGATQTTYLIKAGLEGNTARQTWLFPRTMLPKAPQQLLPQRRYGAP